MATATTTAPQVVNAVILGKLHLNGSKSSATLARILTGASVTHQVLHIDNWEEAELQQLTNGLTSMSIADYQSGQPFPVSPRYQA